MLIDNFYELSSDGEVLLNLCNLAAATVYMDFTEATDEILEHVIDTDEKKHRAQAVEAFVNDIVTANYSWPSIIRQFSRHVSVLERELIAFEVTQTNPFYEQIAGESEDFPWDIVDRKTDTVLDALDVSFNFGTVNTAIENLVENVKEESKSTYTKAGEWLTVGAGSFLEGFGLIGASSVGEWGTEKFLNRKANSLDYEIAAAIYAAAIAIDAENFDIGPEILKQWREIILKEGKKNNPESKKTTATFTAGVKVLTQIVGDLGPQDDDRVPNLKNMKLDKAIVVCKSVGIELNYLDVRAEVPGQNARSIMMTENWTVKRQNPGAGGVHNKNRKVTVYVDR